MDLGMEPLETLLSGETGGKSGAVRRWRNAAKLSLVGVGVLTVACVELMRQRSELQAQLDTQATQLRSQMLQAQTVSEFAKPEIAYAASRPSPDMRSQYTHVAMGSKGQILVKAADVDTCTAAGKDIFANSAGHALPCCDGLVQVSSPCRGDSICEFCVAAASPGAACTPAGTDVGDNNLHVTLKCCPGLIKVDTPCRDGDTCEFCQLKGMGQADCTPPGTDIFANPTGKKLKCCKGLTESTGPCRGDDVCKFCIPSTLEDGERAHHPPAKISVDPATPKAAADKYKEEGMSLIFSDEFKDMARTKAMFVFEDIPYGVPGNTGDVNIVSIYSSDTVSLIDGGGMRLSAYMAPEDEKVFMEGWNGTYNTNYKSDVSLWTWHAPKVTTRLNGRFQYGRIETRIKAPKGYGPWPAAWLNGCYGFIAESSGEFLLQVRMPHAHSMCRPPPPPPLPHPSPPFRSPPRAFTPSSPAHVLPPPSNASSSPPRAAATGRLPIPVRPVLAARARLLRALLTRAHVVLAAQLDVAPLAQPVRRPRPQGDGAGRLLPHHPRAARRGVVLRRLGCRRVRRGPHRDVPQLRDAVGPRRCRLLHERRLHAAHDHRAGHDPPSPPLPPAPTHLRALLGGVPPLSSCSPCSQCPPSSHPPASSVCRWCCTCRASCGR